MRKSAYTPRAETIALAPPLPGLLGQAWAPLAACLGRAVRARAERRRARDGLLRLAAMTDRDLKDIGISRSQILWAVYGPGDDDPASPRRKP